MGAQATLVGERSSGRDGGGMVQLKPRILIWSLLAVESIEQYDRHWIHLIGLFSIEKRSQRMEYMEVTEAIACTPLEVRCRWLNCGISHLLNDFRCSEKALLCHYNPLIPRTDT